MGLKFWEEALKKGIKQTKVRIAQLERKGIGLAVMQEKVILKKQERKLQLRLEKK